MTSLRKGLKKRSQRAGLPQGSLEKIVEKTIKPAHIHVLHYDEHSCAETNPSSEEDCLKCRENLGITWINIEGVSDPERIERIGTHFGLHPLVIEDILNTDQRPKREDFGDYIYLVLHMLSPGANSGEINSEQVSIILGPRYVISIQEGKAGDIFDSLRDRIRKNKGRIRRMGADYLTYALLDTVVDHYFVILDSLGEKIHNLEDEVVQLHSPQTLGSIHELKRTVLSLRRSIWPLREVIAGLHKEETPLLSEATSHYLRDVYDHSLHVIDTIETFREMLSSMLDVYLSSVNNGMNEVMKVLTIITTTFMPLSFIAGIYGMNFKFMPELEWHYGYPLALATMVITATILIIFFRRKRWF